MRARLGSVGRSNRRTLGDVPTLVVGRKHLRADSFTPVTSVREHADGVVGQVLGSRSEVVDEHGDPPLRIIHRAE